MFESATAMFESQYYLLNSDEEKPEIQGETSSLRSSLSPSCPRRFRWTRPHQPWMSKPSIGSTITILLSSISLAILFVIIRDHLVAFDSYETTFSTDIETPFKIPLVKVRTSGSPVFHEKNVMEMPALKAGAVWPENVSYVGNPGLEEEMNWATLVDQASFPITVEEARRAWPDHYQDYYLEEEQKYRAAMDMFHTLHCVNVMRRLAAPEVYGRDIDPHVHHCLEIIRQHVMCYGSTTLIPTKWTPEINQPYIDSDQVHTCRDFNTLHAYMLARRDPENELYAGNQPRE